MSYEKESTMMFGVVWAGSDVKRRLAVFSQTPRSNENDKYHCQLCVWQNATVPKTEWGQGNMHANYQAFKKQMCQWHEDMSRGKGLVHALDH